MIKYIRDKANIIHTSSDNWVTYESLEKKSVEGVEERDQDIVAQVKMRYKLGEKNAKVVIEELETIRKQFKLQSGDGYGHAFEVFTISVLHNIDYDIAIENYIVNGTNDGKIDAIYWNDEVNKVYQIKMDYLDFSDTALMKSNYHEFISTRNISDETAKDLLSFCNKHQRNIVKEKEYEIITVSSNGNVKGHISSDSIFLKFFENQLINRTNKLKVSLTIPKDNGVAKISQDDSIYAYFIDAKTFVDDLLKCENINHKKENLYKFFYDNVRGDLGINKAMETTIAKYPQNFVKYNNGVTITGKTKYIESTPCLIIDKPIINNGQQTIWNLVDKYPNIDKVNLLIIVKNEENDKIKGKISKYTNTQKNIKPIDLLSLDSHIRNLQSALFNLTIKQDPIFLELNTSGKRHYGKILKQVYERENIIPLTDFCKLYFSVESNELGKWKSNVSTKLEEVLKREEDYDVDKSLLICKIITKYKKYLKTLTDKNEKNRLRSADLAFMYIQYKYGYDEIKAHNIIKIINEKYYDKVPADQRKSKLIDLYKTDDIVKIIKEIVASEKKEEMKC